MRKLLAAAFAAILVSGGAQAAVVTVTFNITTDSGLGPTIGTMMFEDSSEGLRIMPSVKDLPPGKHGFHVHQNPDCGPKDKDGKSVPGLAAGSHFDPKGTGKHEGPQGKGHLGDLPLLNVESDGMAWEEIVAPHLKVSDLTGRSIMIHAGGDNFSDSPAALGGGGGRIACGVVGK